MCTTFCLKSSWLLHNFPVFVSIFIWNTSENLCASLNPSGNGEWFSTLQLIISLSKWMRHYEACSSSSIYSYLIHLSTFTAGMPLLIHLVDRRLELIQWSNCHKFGFTSRHSHKRCIFLLSLEARPYRQACNSKDIYNGTILNAHLSILHKVMPSYPTVVELWCHPLSSKP